MELSYVLINQLACNMIDMALDIYVQIVTILNKSCGEVDLLLSFFTSFLPSPTPHILLYLLIPLHTLSFIFTSSFHSILPCFLLCPLNQVSTSSFHCLLPPFLPLPNPSFPVFPLLPHPTTQCDPITKSLC